ncbi:integrase/recombinase xerD homolog [Clytia hemisphaerica]|uniref:integrase/recombinase xerD homolog n=1 Tax=Clytia hemisphaerica TaxID=252671 RepID=UPI0034D650B3
MVSMLRCNINYGINALLQYQLRYQCFVAIPTMLSVFSCSLNYDICCNTNCIPEEPSLVERIEGIKDEKQSSGFLRISKMLQIQIQHITFCQSGVKIFLPKSKTDQIREGNAVFISAKGSYCPIYWLQKYINLAKLSQPNDYLFCRLFKCKIGHSAHGNLPISYTTARDSLKGHLTGIVEDKAKYGLHTLRSGVTTKAANNGVSDRMISKHGRWSSNTSRDTYIKDKPLNRFKVSRQL